MTGKLVETLHLSTADGNKHTQWFEIIETKAEAASKDRFTQTLIRS